MSGERLVETFVELARIPSPSFKEGAIARRVAEMLTEAGAHVRFDTSASQTGSDTGNLIAVLPGTAPGRKVLLSAHLDTVEPCEGVEPVIEDGVIRSAGDTVLGADDKAGVAVIVEAVRDLVESGEPHPEVRVVLTVAEEKGLMGAKALDRADLQADVAVVLDAGGLPGGIVVGSPTHYTFIAEFHGRASHAGVEPEKGASALLMASHAITSMPFGRVDDETTANVGSVEGGTATNVVAPSTRITGECRSRDTKKVEAVRAAMQDAMELAAREFDGRLDIVWTKEYDAVSFDPDDPFLGFVAAACADAGSEARRFVTGGGSDGSILHAKGIPTLVLSCGMENVHSVDESLAVDALMTLGRIVTAILINARQVGIL